MSSTGTKEGQIIVNQVWDEWGGEGKERDEGWAWVFNYLARRLRQKGRGNVKYYKTSLAHLVSGRYRRLGFRLQCTGGDRRDWQRLSFCHQENVHGIPCLTTGGGGAGEELSLKDVK